MKTTCCLLAWRLGCTRCNRWGGRGGSVLLSVRVICCCLWSVAACIHRPPHDLRAVLSVPQCALVVGALWLVGDVGVRKRVLKLLHQKGRTLASLRSVLLEYRANLGAEGGCCLCVRLGGCLPDLLATTPAGLSSPARACHVCWHATAVGWPVLIACRWGGGATESGGSCHTHAALPWDTRKQAMGIQQELQL